MKTRRITANLPSELLRDAMEVTGKGITDTLIDGLQRVRQQRALARIRAIQGKIRLNIDLDESRGRGRR